MKIIFFGVLLTLVIASDAFADELKLALSSPQMRQVVQRYAHNLGQVRIRGTIDGVVDDIEARAALLNGGRGESIPWRRIATREHIKEGAFDGALDVPAGGWYVIEVRARRERRLLAEAKVDKVGIGELFIVAGQSNAANAGAVKQKAGDDHVVAWTGAGWQLADDPMPLAAGEGGSPWPVVGDLLVGMLQVPVGFASVAGGGTAVRHWQPGGNAYARLRKVLIDFGKNGARAVLWHQGESDTAAGTSAAEYAALLGNVIRQSRIDAGYDIPWVVASASWIGPQFVDEQAAIRKGQAQVCDGMLTFAGPETDDMRDDLRIEDQIHMTDKGLKEHGRRWADVLAETFFQKDRARSPWQVISDYFRTGRECGR